jgi:hypothetical protein
MPLPPDQQAADELGGDDLGGAGEEGLGEVLRGRGGYGSGFGAILLMPACSYPFTVA